MKKQLLLLTLFLCTSFTTTVFAQTINLPEELYLVSDCETGLELDGTVINTADTGITYQWYATNSSNFTPSIDNEIPGATNPTYTILPTDTFYYNYHVIATMSDSSTLTKTVRIYRNNDFTSDSVMCPMFCSGELYSNWILQQIGNISYSYYTSEQEALVGGQSREVCMVLNSWNMFGPHLYLRITDTNSSCFDIIPVEVWSDQPYIRASYVGDMGSCTDGYSETNIFDLTSNDDGILYDFYTYPILGPYFPIVTYHLSQNDAWNLTNPIANPESFIATEPNQTIYARISEANGWNNCGTMGEEVTSFRLLSVAKPTPNNTINYVVCDNSSGTSNDGIGLFNLTSRNPLVLAGMSNYNTYYYTTLASAENGTFTNRINNPTTYASANTTVYCRVQDRNTDCYHISQLNLLVQDTCDDISVNLISTRRSPRPGFDYTNKLVVKNNGPSTVSSGTVTFEKDPLITYNSATGLSAGNTLTETATGFTLDFINLAPGETEAIVIDMTVLVSANLGDITTNTASYITNTSDIYPENDTAVLSEVIIGSYDPNDIAETHGPEIIYETFTQDDYLYYTIRFQNVGTASAINVTIDNTLEPKLDKTTFEMLSSSHTNTVERVFDKLTWQFDNINLADATNDEPNSHGYVHYKIKPLPGYNVSDIINNDASIVFDFNAPIVTNTFKTEFVAETLSLNDIAKKNTISIVPNPTNGIVTLSAKSNHSFEKITVYDMLGKEVYQQNNILKQNTTIDVSELKNGIYILKAQTTDGKVSSNRLIKN